MSDGEPIVGIEDQLDRHGSWLIYELILTVGYESSRPTSLVRDWWYAGTGLHPLAVIEEPLTGAVQLEGQIGEGNLKANLVARTELSRLAVAWQYGSRPSPELYPAFDDVRQPFVEFATRWLGFNTLPPIQRLGFGGTLVKLFPRIADCYSDLDSLLPAVDMRGGASSGLPLSGKSPMFGSGRQ